MRVATATSHRQYFSDFAAALRYWRGKRGYSQLQLSNISSISQRHISFLEKGRSQPSKDLILRLGVALEVPLRQRNIMLLAAGFAPAYHERKLTDPEVAPVRRALDFMLAQQLPYPALVVDRLWNLQMANASASGLIRWLLNVPPDHDLSKDGAANVLKMMFDPTGLRQFLVNWQTVCSDLLHWIQREALSDGPGSEATALLDELLALAGGGLCVETPDLDRHTLPFLPMQLRKDGVELNLFTTIATLGTPRDVTLHELRIESFFAADDATAEWFRARA
ncbi:XRE family transcriptional regulator [Candidimonas sp. SYP-B2681]|uniref:helix-turn-helix domain-containing protein n=1 Tax=Candidimonas sp. SYP-B2681 TaxID=2497686 RepID=UPI000F875EB0|nr:helix-turn-helix transcriptional regulator [Candidimonas sp. SYP-B2681]RTZ45544.1 XRE family transcriptional regulator [Candidimonas sp. SYP-B2681]